MKDLFVGDLHFGVNENDENFLRYQKKSLDWILKIIKEQEVTNVHFLGDIFDNRNALSHRSIKLFNWFFGQLGSRVSIVIVGNHDCFYKNTNELNSISLLANQYNVVHSDCVEFYDFLFVPWINKENVETISSQIRNKKCKAKVCVGHFELSGFKMGKGIESQHDNVSRKILDKFDLVISGHYHSYSHKDNICYLGMPYEKTFTDEGENKYIGLYEDGNLELILNPNSYHKQIVVKSEKDLLEISNLTDKKVKVKLECDRTIEIEKWLSELKEKTACDVFEQNEKLVIDENIEINKMELIEIWGEFLSGSQLDIDKEAVNSVFLEEYNKIINGN